MDEYLQTLLFLALLWALVFALHKAADHLLTVYARDEYTSNADRRWAVRMYDYSRTALVVLALLIIAISVLWPWAGILLFAFAI